MIYSPHLNEGNLVKSGIVLADVICGWERSKHEEGEDGGGGRNRTEREGGEWKITPLGERNRRTDEGRKEKQYAEEGDSSFTGVYSTTQRFITTDDTNLNSSFHSAGHNDENISSYNIPPPNIPPPPTPNLTTSNVQHISTSHPQDNLLRKNAVSRFSPELPQVRLLGDSINKVEDEVQEGVEGLMEKVNIYVWWCRVVLW